MVKIQGVAFDDDTQVIVVVLNGSVYELECDEVRMMINGELRYDDAEDFVMDSMLLDESEVETVVPMVAKAILPYIEKYLPRV